jgi:glutathionylspermidine synthase
MMKPYWDESTYYLFTADEVDAIERATYALDEMCLKYVDHVIERNLFDRFQIPVAFVDWIKRSWDRDELTIYGRFDLAYDGTGFPKLLEYNADTPTSLLEAAVIQWYWMKDLYPNLDQFNSLHERLIDAWKRALRPIRAAVDRMYFSAISGNLEDFMTVSYLRDTAMQAGLQNRIHRSRTDRFQRASADVR